MTQTKSEQRKHNDVKRFISSPLVKCVTMQNTYHLKIRKTRTLFV